MYREKKYHGLQREGRWGGSFMFDWNYDKKKIAGFFLFSCFALLLYRTCILFRNYKLLYLNCLVSFYVTFMLLWVKQGHTPSTYDKKASDTS